MKVHTQIRKIAECDQCPNWRGHDSAPRCTAMDVRRGGRYMGGPMHGEELLFPIPEWCPLPDSTDSAKEVK
jgi:hypothetical protein